MENQEQKMPVELETIFRALESKVLRLHWQWANFINLFGINDGRIELLNKTSGNFFFQLQKGMIENIILSISRLTDPVKIGKYKNMTLRLLPSLVDNVIIRKEIEIQFEWYIDKSVEYAREWRKKIYAHSDLDVLQGKVKLEELINKENIELSLKSIRELMHTITKHYRNNKTAYLFAQEDSSNALLRSLESHLNLIEYKKVLRRKRESFPIEIETKRFKIDQCFKIE